MDTTKIEALLAQKFQEEGFEDCFLVDINLSEGNKLEVFVDSDSALTFKKCQQISRYLEKPIDEQGWLGQKYTLEVSSPGLSRPLKFVRQYRKNLGRKLEVKQLEGPTQSGVLTQVEETFIVLEEKVRVKEGKKKVTKMVQHEIPFDNIQQAIVKITF
ncbi:MAG: ribosome maturation factor [Bacteroidota bacterium]